DGNHRFFVVGARFADPQILVAAACAGAARQRTFAYFDTVCVGRRAGAVRDGIEMQIHVPSCEGCLPRVDRIVDDGRECRGEYDLEVGRGVIFGQERLEGRVGFLDPGWQTRDVDELLLN